ncbi:hypothetical protein CcaverHIS002_0307140 [Cutaneotrichosporon cavernicola]|uniref:ZIP zinc/iron transport family n=1 Tax=Cutaneotrichosporon cavernicola TaxID=279322 RepID=A0AA48L226_9TREE|nr:uncharacterized protein CcaverHIS019_0307050 [Cutaneotrichosporon cavernicola]BEI82846.1 hypothetical protein CcaverHIS002_0307140 [Cutaneotrichosporon cavernicola]BEI90635.1 hypothetical protein CcaverHIS019_0307050 [Cutaneotrichosporon cavernicola]BEI98413.1 hypothetical protein CcaverHIS631_0307120 [Cutaneotrichosporon cavernicola]BEJ06186.1 hypothetical protein CcaverHIS641_0307080 [Cutaneotrichosporon cavernicola]
MSDAPAPDACAPSLSESHWGLRIGAIFIILATSAIGTLLPILLHRSSVVPRAVFDFAKYFGSGVIIATAFIHLLAPAFDALGSECLSGIWHDYDFAPAFALIAVFAMFFAEVAAYRIGTKKLLKLGMVYSTHVEDETDAHAHSHQHDPPLAVVTSGPSLPGHVHPAADLGAAEAGHGHGVKREGGDSDSSSLSPAPSEAEASAQLVAVAVLEFGVILHSIIIGLTLAVSEQFIILFVVIVFHQMFEGLGLGSRLAGLHLAPKLGWARYAAALLYSICTPIGVAVGLGIRHGYNDNGVAKLIVSGVLDGVSAGILLYTGLVELLAHEILLNPRMMQSSNGKLAYVFFCMSLGAGLMALLGRWA